MRLSFFHAFLWLFGMFCQIWLDLRNFLERRGWSRSSVAMVWSTCGCSSRGDSAGDSAGDSVRDEAGDEAGLWEKWSWPDVNWSTKSSKLVSCWAGASGCDSGDCDG